MRQTFENVFRMFPKNRNTILVLKIWTLPFIQTIAWKTTHNALLILQHNLLKSQSKEGSKIKVGTSSIHCI